MIARRLVCCAVLAALGRHAMVAAQQPVTLPLRQASALMMVDEWTGLSAIAPTRTACTLRRAADGSFAGTVQISVGSGLARRDTSFAVLLPAAAADSLLRALSEVPLREGSYSPTLTHTDDYPSITVDVTVGDSVVQFHTTSQGRAYVPWRVSARGRTYASDSEAIWPAVDGALGPLARVQKRAIIEAARADPESQCTRGPFAEPWLTERPRYAGGEAWFARDSVITVQGARYRKLGLARLVGLHEISLHATYRGVPVFKELGTEGTPNHLYVPVRASCEVQPYALEPRP